jgi:hypothetical protein
LITPTLTPTDCVGDAPSRLSDQTHPIKRARWASHGTVLTICECSHFAPPLKMTTRKKLDPIFLGKRL